MLEKVRTYCCSWGKAHRKAILASTLAGDDPSQPFYEDGMLRADAAERSLQRAHMCSPDLPSIPPPGLL